MFFSATMPKTIAELGDRFLTDPVKVSVTPVSSTAERVDQYVTFVSAKEKQALLSIVLKKEPIDRALVFTRTKHGADKVVKHLTAAGIRSVAIHGNKSQNAREAALASFRKGETPILIATDIAARGIDVSGVSHVFNYELPNVAEQYVHRIGRTARAGAAGIAVAFVDGEEKAYLRGIEKLTGVKLQPVPLPEGFAEEAAKLPKPVITRDAPRGRDAGHGGHRHNAPRSSGGGDGEQRRFRPQRPRASAHTAVRFSASGGSPYSRHSRAGGNDEAGFCN